MATRQTQPRSAVLTVLLVLLVVMAGRGQAAGGPGCVPFSGSPLTGHKCDPLVTWPNVLLLPGRSYSQADETASRMTRVLGAFVPPQCRDAALRLVCMGSFVPCSFDLTTGSLSFEAPCRSVCEAAVAECAGFLAAAGLAHMIPDCDATNPLTGGPLYPTVACNPADFNRTVGYGAADCPYPLRYTRQDAVEDDPSSLCVMPCPAPMFTDEQWAANEGILISVSFISISMLGFMCITWLLNPVKRRFPAFFPFWLALCALITHASVAVLPVLVGGMDRVLCTWDDGPDEVPVQVTWDNAGENGGQGVVCFLQSILACFFALAGSFWWLCLTFNFFELLVLNMKPLIARRIYYAQHAISWGIPSTSIIIALSGQSLESAAGNAICFVGVPYHWAVFYSWVLLNLVVGTTLMVFAIIKVVRMKALFKTSKVKSSQIVRMGLLVAVYYFVYCYFCFYRLYARGNEDDWEQAVRNQVECSVRTGEACPLRGGADLGVWIVQTFSLSAPGIILTLTLCFTKDNFLFWLDLLRNWRNPMLVIADSSSSGKSERRSTMLSSSVSAHASLSRSKSLSEDDPGL